MAVIEIADLRKTYVMGSEAVAALDGISFEVAKGELLSIVGPSGCGKSTLMNILGLLDTPETGVYRLAGTPVQTLTDDERSRLRNRMLGFVFQHYNLLPRMSACRNVEMPLVYAASYDKGLSRSVMRERALEALARVNLEHRVDHAPNELSGGQCQRVAIARALVNRPELLLADEPTGNLDSKSGHEILGLFKELNRQGVTIVIVTHDPKVAASADRTIEMLDGRILSDRRRDAD